MYVYFPNIQRVKNSVSDEIRDKRDNSINLISLATSISSEVAGISFTELIQLQALQEFSSQKECDQFIDKYESLIGTTIKSGGLFDEEQIDCEYINTAADLVYHCYFRWQKPGDYESVEDFVDVSLNGWEWQVLRKMLCLSK